MGGINRDGERMHASVLAARPLAENKLLSYILSIVPMVSMPFMRLYFYPAVA